MASRHAHPVRRGARLLGIQHPTRYAVSTTPAAPTANSCVALDAHEKTPVTTITPINLTSPSRCGPRRRTAPQRV